MAAQVQLGDLTVDVIKKDIKNVHLSVHPPTGRVRISAPTHMDLDTIRVFAISKLKRNPCLTTGIGGSSSKPPRP
jgi:predicted metal-dependent hydrolase